MKLKWISMACVCLFPLLSHAYYRPVVTLSLGSEKANTDLNSSVTLIAPFQNSYISTDNANTEAVGGVFLGFESCLNSQLFYQLGFSYFQNSAFLFNGDVLQFADPDFNNLTYSFNVRSKRIMLEGKILGNPRHHFHPYVAGGLGFANNQAYGYSEIPKTTDAVPMEPGFSNRTYSSFTYAIGLGLDVDITQHIRFGGGYRFSDLGKIGLGTTPLQEGNQTLTNNHLYTHTILFQFSYLG